MNLEFRIWNPSEAGLDPGGPPLANTIKSGQVQKFEVCSELFWKTAKHFLWEIHGLESFSPKMAIKGLYRTQYIDEQGYEKLLAMINDRNRLSHIYSEEQFNEIYMNLPDYLHLMKSVVEATTSHG